MKLYIAIVQGMDDDGGIYTDTVGVYDSYELAEQRIKQLGATWDPHDIRKGDIRAVDLNSDIDPLSWDIIL